ncbi:hypothetical protein CANINC_002751 [Pichia inconspicua]|uniref:Alpha box domain-containing protein n=1 Tax=Pichia inconspicua TaxID=52247 RepID=A0A4T0X1P0_9ASCO|nr:hypothetical protein CANINC_002751 [[Candida] inconspicua]
MGKSNRGAISIRVKRQRLNKETKKSQPKLQSFVSSPSKIYTTPKRLQDLLQNISPGFRNRAERTIYKSNIRIKEKKTSMNGFIAFRTYYSNIGKTYEDQSRLSKELAAIWKNDASLQREWQTFAEEYNASGNELPFLNWFELNKTDLKPQENDVVTQRTNISHLIVEDIYPVDTSEITNLTS